MNMEKLDETIEAIEKNVIERAKVKGEVDSETVSALASLIQARTLCEE